MKSGLLDFEDERSFVLREMEVFNWGPFSGKHRAQIDPEGTAIIGATGSGKTTLVDGLMTLLADNPRYNLASTGGKDKNDRTLLSYIRGVLGSEGPQGGQVARPSKTVTGLAGSYHNSSSKVQIGGIFWLDGTSNSQQDLKRRWFFCENNEDSLDGLLRQFGEGGARQLMKHGRETAGLRIFENKKAYLAHLRKFFDVSENAFNLLNRAAGLKQLDSVDAIFRELVLDDKSAFDRAIEVAQEFDVLSSIHKELEDARRQQQSLLPVKDGSENLAKLRRKLAEARSVKSLAPRWYARRALTLWESTLTDLEVQQEKAHAIREGKESELSLLQARSVALQEQYLALGGSSIETLEEGIRNQKRALADRQREANDYLVIAKAMGLESGLSAATLQRNQALLAEKRPQLELLLAQTDEREAETRSRLREVKTEALHLEENLRGVKANSSSNIPLKFQQFRGALARHLSLPDDDLPYVAELIEVKSEEANWRGAIERTIGADRLRILVPTQSMREAARWVNGRDNRLHVRLEEARLHEPEQDYFYDSFIHKLNLKKHLLLPALENLLARRDRHCVASPEELLEVEHGLTQQGMESGRHGRLDKQDQKRLDEDWMTGFDNADQLRHLATRLEQARSSVAELANQVNEQSAARKKREGELRLLDRVCQLDFDAIDSPSAERALQALQEKLLALLAPDSEASAAKAAFEQTRQEIETGNRELNEIRKQENQLEFEIERGREQQQQARERCGQELNEEEEALAKRYLRIPAELLIQGIDQAEREALQRIEVQIEKRGDRVQEQERRLVAAMGSARALNAGPYVDVGCDLEDIPHYLAELKKITEEGLPEKRERFLAYLNRSSDQGVTQLLSHVEQEVTNIEERIADLNQTLTKVDFREGRFLQLAPNRIKDERLRTLQMAQRQLRSAELKDDEGRSHFQALQNVVTILREAGNNRRTLGSRALLDSRYRLQFYVIEVDRTTGETSARRTGSQSGSGGEKELMASHILTASLSYALCPVGASRPLYGTIVLDEAFSKSSQSAARLIVKALSVFGLHPIFVTPNKEISLLKKHTRRAICVQRGANGSSLATISWQKLAEKNPHQGVKTFTEPS